MRDILFAMNLQEFFLKQKEAARSRTRQVVGMIRPEQMTWRPEKDALTIGEMVRHLWVPRKVCAARLSKETSRTTRSEFPKDCAPWLARRVRWKRNSPASSGSIVRRWPPSRPSPLSDGMKSAFTKNWASGGKSESS